MNRDDYRHLLLSGTVTFPATFPQVGSISLICEPIPSGIESYSQREILVVKEFPSAKVTIARKVFADKVRAVFVPQDLNRVSYACGTWLLGNEIAEFLRCRERTLGIVFVSETEPTLLDVNAGMTAGESAQYYPPLPSDRSFNHYGGPNKQRHAMSCDGPESPQATESVGSMVVKGLSLEAMFSCDGHDDISFELCSCDGSDTSTDS